MVAIRSLTLISLQLVAIVAATLGMQYMPVGNGVNFAYLDSGPALDSSRYTTFVFLHGLGFNAAIFHPILLIAQLAGVRVVSVNRRDYSPTTLLRSGETALLTQGDDGQRAFLQQRGTEFAAFLDGFIQRNRIPQANPDNIGGIVVVGWSFGCITAHSLLAHLDSVPSETINRLKDYLHTIVMHDPGAPAVGFENPPEYDISLWLEPNVAKRFNLFKDWATSFYTHKDFNPETGSVETLEYNIPNTKVPTLQNIPSFLVNPMLDQDAFGGAESSVLYISQAVSRELTRQALFNTTTTAILPRVRVRYFYAAETPGALILTSWLITDLAKDPSAWGGVRSRDVGLHYATRGNHFLFFDDPLYALQQYKAAVQV